MEAFGIIGLSMGTMGFIFALNALDQVRKLEQKLKDSGIIDADLPTGNTQE